METIEHGVVETISPHDLMFNPADPKHYFSVGESALKSIRLAVELSEVRPAYILDLPSGHGRVLRWLVKEYPDATITACDIDRDAVEFCAEHFGAVPLYSDIEPEAIPLSRYNLVWIGSLFTHLDAPLWSRFLSVLSKRTAVVVFTTGGRYFGEEAARREVGENARPLMDSFATAGFGYVEYRSTSGYGLALAKPSWVLHLLERLSLRVLHFAEGGWGQQDVYVCRHG
jgi:trans-aconitate methyltransferase